jgi:hypothetical protein
VADRNERAHVEHGTDARASTPHGPLLSQRPAVTSERRHADQRRDLLAIQSPQLREIETIGNIRPVSWLARRPFANPLSAFPSTERCPGAGHVSADLEHLALLAPVSHTGR